MEKKDVLDVLQGIFTEVLKEPTVNINYDTTAKDVDGWDSITNMTIISELEKHYGVRLKLREIIKMKSVGDLCDTVVAKLQ
jgi:acyl carrier protein